MNSVLALLLVVTLCHAESKMHPQSITDGKHYPFLAQLTHEGCGGSLLAPEWILTSSRCVKVKSRDCHHHSEEGDVQIQKCTTYGADKESYDYLYLLNGELAVVHLPTAAEISNTVWPVPVLSKDTAETPFSIAVDKNAVATGSVHDKLESLKGKFGRAANVIGTAGITKKKMCHADGWPIIVESEESKVGYALVGVTSTQKRKQGCQMDVAKYATVLANLAGAVVADEKKETKKPKESVQRVDPKMEAQYHYPLYKSTNVPEDTVWEAAFDGPEGRAFASAVQRSIEYPGKGPYTLLIPTDEAFKARFDGPTLNALWQRDNKKTLAGLAAYHILPGKLSASDLTFGVHTTQYRPLVINPWGGEVPGPYTQVCASNIEDTLVIAGAGSDSTYLDPLYFDSLMHGGKHSNVARVLESVEYKNGWIHYIDNVLTPEDINLCRPEKTCDDGEECQDVFAENRAFECDCGTTEAVDAGTAALSIWDPWRCSCMGLCVPKVEDGDE